MKKLTLAYSNTKHKTIGYSPHFLLLGRQGRLPFDIIFGIEGNSFQQTNCDSYVKNWQKAESDTHKIVNQNIHQRNNSNNEMYDKKVYGQSLVAGDRLRTKNVPKRGVTEKLQSFWDNEIYKVVFVRKDLLIYQVQPEKSGSKIKPVQHNLLFLCNQLPSKKSYSKNVL